MRGQQYRIAQFLQPCEFKKLFSVEPLSFESDWFETAVAESPVIFCAIDPERLFFGGQWQPTAQANPQSTAGEFFEGLWTHDLVEVFFKTTDGYLEINLAPNGAWWLMRFSDYRTRKGITTLPQCWSYQQNCRAAVSFPLTELNLVVDPIIGNLTACHAGKFLTYRRLEVSAQPDFHRMELFQPIPLYQVG